MRHLRTLRDLERIARAGSLRRAAAELGITPSALNRRILALEAELGVPLFERLPKGLRPNTAGEILLDHIRRQLADMERVRSRIADLSGMRAGHVEIVATRECVPHFLPELIRAHVAEFPGVTFGVTVSDPGEAEEALHRLEADIALVFGPSDPGRLHPAAAVPQRLWCVMAEDHPLTARDRPRLWECAGHPLLLPRRREGVRQLLERVAARIDLRLLPQVEADSPELLGLLARGTRMIAFTVDVGLPPDPAGRGLAVRALDMQGVPAGLLVAAQLRHRALSVAAGRFLETVARALALRFG